MRIGCKGAWERTRETHVMMCKETATALSEGEQKQKAEAQGEGRRLGEGKDLSRHAKTVEGK